MARGAGLAHGGRDRDGLDLVLQNAGSYPELDARDLERWLQALVGALAPRARSLGVRLCGDRAMQRLNREFRGRDSVTDVLSFPGESVEHLGDIVVCVAQARRQAAGRGAALERETRTLLLHGVLHCMGYDHETDQGEMARLERTLRRRWLERR
jgi:probable rRNA maturation factor